MERTPTHISDKTLARQAAEGDRAAFNEIVRRYGRSLVEFVAARTTTYEDAEDIVQETFLRVWRYLRSYDAQYSLKTWLFTITYRILVSHYRKKKPISLPVEDIHLNDAVTDPTEGTEHNWLWDVARQMDSNMFSCLWLRYQQDMPIREIACVMKKSQAAVRVLLHRSRKRLGEKLGETKTDCSNKIHGAFSGIPCFERTQ